jgi:type I restriction enzyme R subunit
MKPITEDKIETFAIEVLQSMGWEYAHGLAIAPGAEQAERENFEQIILVDRLRKSVAVLNPNYSTRCTRTSHSKSIANLFS